MWFSVHLWNFIHWHQPVLSMQELANQMFEIYNDWNARKFKSIQIQNTGLGQIYRLISQIYRLTSQIYQYLHMYWCQQTTVQKWQRCVWSESENFFSPVKCHLFNGLFNLSLPLPVASKLIDRYSILIHILIYQS